MRHLRMLPCLGLFVLMTWPDEHGRGGILFSDWELRRVMTAEASPVPGMYRLASFTADAPLAESRVNEATLPDLLDLPGSENSADEAEETTETENPPLRAPAPRVAIEDMCVAMASAAQLNDLPVGFFARLIWQESKFGQWVVSHAGAQGVAQFMPKTAAWIGLSDPFDPIAALPASARFLKMLREQFGNLGLAAAAYNGGPGRLQNWLSGRSGLPDETRNYVRIITGHQVEKWTAAGEIDVSFHLPTRAPCEGLAGLSREAKPVKLAVTLEPGVVKMIETARAEAAKRAARAALLARKLAAKKKGQGSKIAASASRKLSAGKKAPSIKQAGRPLNLATN